ncbi:MAG TPA: DMT family transporter [Sandaracinaceae bacterium LLY-WYZ-13_1]|nr:DMT family transporter [Sandaracinaceae bacterium LLY-WYZ-13_1]
MQAADDDGDPRRGVALALGSAVFAAGFLLAFRNASREAPRELVVFAMLAFSAGFNGAVAGARVRSGPRWPSRVTVLTVLVLAGLTVAGNVGVSGALARLDPGLTSTILQTQVFVVGILARLFLGEPLTGRFALGALFAVVGFGVLAIDDPAAATVDPVGVLFALLGSAGFGAMLVWTRGVIERIDPVAVNVARLALAVGILAPFAWAHGGLTALPPPVWGFAALAAACGPFASRLCLMFAVKHLTASRTKLLTLTTPVFAFGFELALLAEVPRPREIAGAALILLGVVLPVLSAERGRG